MYCVAPYEADPQLAFMVASGLADFAVTEDSDLIAYCCPSKVFKLNLRGECQTVYLTSVIKSLSISKEQLTDMGILSGCDYCKLAGVGINKAIDRRMSIQKMPRKRIPLHPSWNYVILT